LFILSLEVLNISGNNLDSLEELSCLERLQDLTASNNCLNNLRELIQLLSIWKNVKRLDTSRNPFCVKARYRERLIVSSTTLGPKQIFELIKQIRSFFQIEMLDGKQITDNSRQFLRNWKASREAQQLKEKSKSDINDDPINTGGKSNSNLPTKANRCSQEQNQTLMLRDFVVFSFLPPIRSFVARARAVPLHPVKGRCLVYTVSSILPPSISFPTCFIINKFNRKKKKRRKQLVPN